MKKILTYKDSYYKATNTLFESNGVKVLVCVKPDIVDFSADIIFKGGAYFEKQKNIPNGTAHFLEHMMCNPNKAFKTHNDIKQYEFGSRTRAEIYANAATGQKYVSYYGSTHNRSTQRLLRFLQYRIDYPIERFEEFIEKERGIILAELQAYEPEEKDATLDFQRFMYGQYQRSFGDRIIGTDESIRAITIEHLNHIRDSMYVKNRAIVTVQTHKLLVPSQVNIIDKITNLIPDKNIKVPEEEKDFLKNTYKHKIFLNEKAQGIGFVFGYFTNKMLVTDYPEAICRYLLRTLMWYLSQRLLREEKALIYGMSANMSNVHWHNYAINFETRTEFNKITDFLENLSEVIYKKAIEFLKSEDGKTWFEGQISRYIFTRTISYDDDYARNEANSFLLEENDPFYDFSKALKAARELKIETFEAFYNKMILKQKPHVWMETASNTEEVLKIYESSTLHKRWKSEI